MVFTINRPFLSKQKMWLSFLYDKPPSHQYIEVVSPFKTKKLNKNAEIPSVTMPTSRELDRARIQKHQQAAELLSFDK